MIGNGLMHPSDSLIAAMPLPVSYLVGDFELDLLEMGSRTVLFAVEENETYGWPPRRFAEDWKVGPCDKCGGTGEIRTLPPYDREQADWEARHIPVLLAWRGP